MAGHHACPRELGVVLLPFLLVAFVAFKPVYWTCYVRKRKRVVLGLQNNEAVLVMSTRKSSVPRPVLQTTHTSTHSVAIRHDR